MKLDSKDYTPSDLLDLFCTDLAYGTNTIDSLLDKLEIKSLHNHHRLCDSLDFITGYIDRLGVSKEVLDEYIENHYFQLISKKK